MMFQILNMIMCCAKNGRAKERLDVCGGGVVVVDVVADFIRTSAPNWRPDERLFRVDVGVGVPDFEGDMLCPTQVSR